MATPLQLLFITIYCIVLISSSETMKNVSIDVFTKSIAAYLDVYSLMTMHKVNKKFRMALSNQTNTINDIKKLNSPKIDKVIENKLNSSKKVQIFKLMKKILVIQTICLE